MFQIPVQGSVHGREDLPSTALGFISGIVLPLRSITSNELSSHLFIIVRFCFIADAYTYVTLCTRRYILMSNQC